MCLSAYGLMLQAHKTMSGYALCNIIIKIAWPLEKQEDREMEQYKHLQNSKILMFIFLLYYFQR